MKINKKSCFTLLTLTVFTLIFGIQDISARDAAPEKVKPVMQTYQIAVPEKLLKVYLSAMRKIARTGKYKYLKDIEKVLKKKGIKNKVMGDFGRAYAFYQMSENARAKLPYTITPKTKILLDKYGPQIEKEIKKTARNRDVYNLKLIGIFIFEYAAKYDGKIPENLAVLVKEQGSSSLKLFQSSVAKAPPTLEELEKNKADYMYAHFPDNNKLTKLISPSTTSLVMTRPRLFGNDHVVVLYADGHVESFDASKRNLIKN